MSEKISLITWMANVQIRFFTWRHGEVVGTDRFGNTYYRDKKSPRSMRERRWVMYNGEPEASKVPAEWHSWLHHSAKEPLPEAQGSANWKANPSGSAQAYRPPGHAFKGGVRAPATGDYEPWTPK